MQGILACIDANGSVAACQQDRLGLDRRRDRTALQREWPARDRDPLHDRAIVAQAYLRAVR
jgi:hypothetical protein